MFLEHSVDVGVYIDGSFDRQQQIYVRVVERRLLTPSLVNGLSSSKPGLPTTVTIKSRIQR